jgi:hypothetical protein
VNIQPEQLLRAMQHGQAARYQAERRTFLRRHHKLSVPWLMFCIGYALGVAVMLLNF